MQYSVIINTSNTTELFTKVCVTHLVNAPLRELLTPRESFIKYPILLVDMGFFYVWKFYLNENNHRTIRISFICERKDYQDT